MNAALPKASSPSQPEPRPRLAGVRPHVAALIFLLQALIVWWVADSEILRSIYFICYSLMMPTVLYLLLGRVLQHRLRLDRRELLFGYVVLTCTLPIIGFGGIRFLMVGMGYLSYFATTQPQWVKYLPYLGSLPVLHDAQAIRAFYNGGSPVPWRAWLVPIGFWSVYLLLLQGLWIGLAALLRRLWIHEERLTFPIAVLPLQLTDPQVRLFRRPLFWLGFAIPVALQSLLALHDWFPSIPAFQLKSYDIKPFLFTTPPWNAFPDLQLGFYPMAIGLAYFVPSSVSFSCLFFWLTAKLSYPIGAMLGVEGGGSQAARFPFKDEQAAGAWIAFGGLALWALRQRWAGLVQSVASEERRALRQMSLLAAGCLLAAAALMIAVGIPWLIAAGILAIYAAFVLSGARIRAEAGSIWTFGPVNWTPDRVMNGLLGSQVNNQVLVAEGHFYSVHIDVRGQSLPYQMEGLKIGDTVGIPWQTVLKWVAVGTVTALALGWWFSLADFYSVGAATAKSNTYVMVKTDIGMNEMDRFASNRIMFDWPGMKGVLFGAGLTTLLAWLRTRLLFFPLHPVGYVLCNTYSMSSFFMPFLIAWTVKVLVQRYGGNAVYRRSLAFFVGLTLGDIVIQAAWAIIGKVLNVPIYQFLS
ncbi:MAG TPA: DUF6785 family protein [Chthonomonadaceae bacterium]|nr:DUF6785 family protein [Chthonomonadaceae bacterium]